MLDKGHCFMNVDDEEEYQKFYDFSKSYQNYEHLLIPNETPGEDGPAQQDSFKAEEWEDVDVEDAQEEDLDEVRSVEEEKSLSAISIEKSASSETEPGFSIISSAKKEG